MKESNIPIKIPLLTYSAIYYLNYSAPQSRLVHLLYFGMTNQEIFELLPFILLHNAIDGHTMVGYPGVYL